MLCTVAKEEGQGVCDCPISNGYTETPGFTRRYVLFSLSNGCLPVLHWEHEEHELMNVRPSAHLAFASPSIQHSGAPIGIVALSMPCAETTRPASRTT